MSENNINISGVGGDVVGVGVSGSGNIIGGQINVSGQLTLNAQQLAQMPDDYASSLKAFCNEANRQLKANKVPPEKVAEVQTQMESLATEVEGLPADEPPPPTRKLNIAAKFANMAKGLLKVLPDTAETIAAFTPLAPFSKLIGTGVEELVKSIRKEG
jgi:hypothetical protein